MRTHPRTAATIFLLAVFGVLAAPSGPANAASSAACQVRLGGVNIDQAFTASRALTVDARTPVPVLGGPATGVTGHRLEMQLAGVTFYRSPIIPVHQDHTWSGDLQVDKLGKLGVGIYRFTDRVFGPAGCTTTAYIRLSGRSPFLTASGAAAALAILAGLAVAFVPLRRTREVRDGAISELFRGGSVAWRFRPSGIGAFGGLLAAGGALGLLEGFAVVYLTPFLLGGGLVLGLIAGALLPTPFHRSAVNSAVRQYGREQT